MLIETNTLPDNPEELKRIILRMQNDQHRFEKENDLLREEVRLLYARLFGKKSEKGGMASTSVQIPLFDMPEPGLEPEEEKVEVPAHTRQKSARKKLPVELPRIDIVHDITDEEKVCNCGASLCRIGEDVSEKLDIIPSVIQVIRHIRPKYSCKQCEGLETEGAVVKIAPVPKQIITKGIATAGLLAHILTAKFCDALPFYRQECQFERLGAEIPRQTMCNWAMKAAKACEPLLIQLKKEIRSGPLINIDETTVQVLRESGRSPTTKSYMWICRGGAPARPALEDFFKRLSKKALQVVPKSLLGIAVHYTLRQWMRLVAYIDHAEMTPDNNAAENAIRPFVIGRKNWLFAGNPEGARASAIFYSLIETAKANKLEPYKYLRYLFEKLPFAETHGDISALLPMNLKAEDLIIGQVVTGV